MASAREEGVIKIFAEDYLAHNKVHLFSGRTNSSFPDAAKTNLTLAPHIPFAKGGVMMLPQTYLRVYLYADAADTLDEADMLDAVQIPITLIKNDTGAKEEVLLNVGDVGLATDATTVASTDIKILEYQIPYGYHAFFGIAASEDSLQSRLLIIPMDDTA